MAQSPRRGGVMRVFYPGLAGYRISRMLEVQDRLLRCGHCGRKMHVSYWGKSGTSPRYRCKGTFDAGGTYCVMFGGAGVDRRFTQELLRVISPLGLQASLEAVEGRKQREHEQRQTLAHKLEQLQYEAQRAFEQYNEVDPRYRLVAAELERRWNAKLEEVEAVQATLAALSQPQRTLTEDERATIVRLGHRFSEVWNSPALSDGTAQNDHPHGGPRSDRQGGR